MVKAWREPEPPPDEPGRRTPDEATMAELTARGINLDPAQPRATTLEVVAATVVPSDANADTVARMADQAVAPLPARAARPAVDGPRRGREHEPGHEHDPGDGREPGHPHPHHDPGERPVIGIVGAGAVGTALGVALSRAGWPITAVASRDPERRERFRRLVSGVRGFSEPNALLDDVDLVVLAVPDDAIAGLAGSIRLYSGQALVHTSGLLGAEVLAPAMAAGTQIGAFHPLVAFADLERAVAALHGATIAVEGDDQLVALLADMAEAVGGIPVRLAPGAKAAYHAAAVLAAGGVVALLDAIAELGRVAGLDERSALAVYLPLMRQTIDNAEALGVRMALTGPFTRGDAGTLAAHLAELRRDAPGVVELYLALGRRELDLAEARGALTPEGAARLRASLAKPA